MKKLCNILIALALFAATFSGCANTGTPQTTEGTPNESSVSTESNTTTETPPEPEEGLGELNIAIFEGGYGPDFWNQIVERFEADNPGVTINLQISPTIGDIIRPQIVAGNAPDFMNLTDNDQTGIVAALIKERGLLELTDFFDGPQYDASEPLKDKIIDGFLQSNKCAPYGDGKIYLAPGTGGPMGLIYNKTLFEENGWELPVTWDDFFALGEKAKEKDIALFTYQGIYPSYMESMLLPAVASALGLEDFKQVESFQPGIWSDPRVLAVLEKFQEIYTGGYLMNGTVALNHTDAQTAQMQNQALFIPCGTWMEDEMKDVETASGYRFGLAPPPVMNQGDTRYIASYVEQFSIPASSKDPELAKRFLSYLYTDEAIEMYARLNGGAVMVTNNALDLVQADITEGVYGMFGAYSEPGAASLIIGFEAPPENTRIVFQDEIFNPLSDLMTGRITAAQWAESMDQAYQDMQDGM